MKVLVACEHSGTVREAFRALGHDAWSCDLLPSSDKSEFHYHTDVFRVLSWDEWDMLIAHPPCTYVTNSAEWAFKDADFTRYPRVGYHQKVKPGTLVGATRRAARVEAVEFARQLWLARVPRICIENPVGHLSQHLGDSRLVQPYQFGDDASKGTCLWLKGLPPLVIDPAWRKAGRMVMHSGKLVERWSNQTDAGQNRLSPSDDRGHLRAITYPGIARQMAAQWGNL